MSLICARWLVQQAAAKTRLAEVQHAYEVLSEPERRYHAVRPIVPTHTCEPSRRTHPYDTPHTAVRRVIITRNCLCLGGEHSDAWSPLARKHYDRYGFDELDEQTPYADKDKKLVDFYEGSKV